MRILQEQASEIADCMMCATMDGKTLSTQLLLRLVEGNPGMEKALKKKPLLSVAMRLAQERQLPPEALDAAEEALAKAEAVDGKL